MEKIIFTLLSCIFFISSNLLHAQSSEKFQNELEEILIEMLLETEDSNSEKDSIKQYICKRIKSEISMFSKFEMLIKYSFYTEQKIYSDQDVDEYFIRIDSLTNEVTQLLQKNHDHLSSSLDDRRKIWYLYAIFNTYIDTRLDEMMTMMEAIEKFEERP